MNLEDVVLHEQKLGTILDVSTFLIKVRLIVVLILEFEKRRQCFLVLRGLVGFDGDH